MSREIDEVDELIDIVLEASRLEKLSGMPRYIAFSVPDKRYFITDKMPMMGEWYTTDAIKHGGKI